MAITFIIDYHPPCFASGFLLSSEPSEMLIVPRREAKSHEYVIEFSSTSDYYIISIANKTLKIMKLTASFFILFIIVIACSPEPVLRLQSDQSKEERVMVYQGMEYLMSEDEHSMVILAYYRHIEDRVIFDLEVFNDSEEPVRFDPSSIEYKAYWAPETQDNDPKTHQGNKIVIENGNAHDPEFVLLNIDKETSRAEARNRTNVLLEAVVSGLAAAAEISEGTSSSYSKQRARQERRQQRAERRENYYQYVSGLNEKRNYWETEMLRISDLMPGKSAAGEISIPVTKNAGMLDLIIQIAGETHTFNYRQKAYEP
ncbi:MAG: hypothetical protein JJU13_14650 [Balneolaceae bacterium]|nr:hypothetical protein [Balneolaceae bacterium]